MVLGNKIKTLLVCNDDLPRTLTTIELQKHSEIDFVGSSSYDSTMKRFLTIYKPDIVVVYAYGKKKGEYYKCVRYLRQNTSSRIVVIVPEMADYDVNLFFRYGAHSVTDGNCDLIQLIKETSYQLNVTKFPSNLLYTIPLKKDNHASKLKRGSVEAYVASNSLYVRRRTHRGETNTKQVMTSLFRLRKDEANKCVLKLKSTRELPEKSSDLVDYGRLYPETFCALETYGIKEKGPERFLFVVTQEIVRNVETLRNREREEIDKGDVNYKGYTYDYEMSERFRIGYDKK